MRNIFYIWHFDRGYRLAATTVLPIDNNTLIYGSGTFDII